MRAQTACGRLPAPACLLSASIESNLRYFSIAPIFALIDGFAEVPVIVTGIPRFDARVGFVLGCRSDPTTPPTALAAVFATAPTAFDEFSFAIRLKSIAP